MKQTCCGGKLADRVHYSYGSGKLYDKTENSRTYCCGYSGTYNYDEEQCCY